MGTLDYMAPEQADDSHEVDGRADIYSLGATLYRLLCGVPPFSGAEYRSPLRKFRALALLPVPPLRDRRAVVPPELARIVERMLAKEPADRFASPLDVAEALRPFAARADLAGLLETAQNRSGPDERSGDFSPHDPGNGNGRSGDGNSGDSAARKPDPAGEPAPHPAPRKRRIAVRFLQALAASLALLAAGFVVHVQTDKGELVIRSSEPDVQVRVRRSGRPVEDFQIRQGETRTRLRSGEYEIVLLGRTDGLKVNGDVFTIVSASSVSNQFNGLSDGDEVMFNGIPLTVNYTSTAVTLTADLNTPPVAHAGGPYEVIVGGSLTLDASESFDPDGDALTFAWDLTGNGDFSDATGETPTLSWNDLAALGDELDVERGISVWAVIGHPLLAAVGLEREHIVGIVVHAQSLRDRRGDVGVCLDRVGEGQLQVADQPRDRLPVPVQSLQHDGRAVSELRVDPPHVDEVRDVSGPDPRVRGVGRLWQRRPLFDEAECGGAETHRRHDLIHVYEREEVGEVLPPVQVDLAIPGVGEEAVDVAHAAGEASPRIGHQQLGVLRVGVCSVPVGGIDRVAVRAVAGIAVGAIGRVAVGAVGVLDIGVLRPGGSGSRNRLDLVVGQGRSHISHGLTLLGQPGAGADPIPRRARQAIRRAWPPSGRAGALRTRRSCPPLPAPRPKQARAPR
jgi:hypothetical protein